MKKKIVILILMICFLISGCSAEGSKNYTSHTGLMQVSGRENQYYDPETQIVYILFNEYSGYIGYGYMSAYYAPNGLPYRYDPLSNELMEIN